MVESIPGVGNTALPLSVEEEQKESTEAAETESTDESASAEGASETQGSESTDGSTSTDSASGGGSSTESASAAQDTTSIFSTQTEGYIDTTYGDGGVQSNSDINSKGIEDVLNEGSSSEFATLSKEDQEAYLEAYGLASETGEIEGYTYTTNDKGEGYYVSDDGTEFIKVIGEDNGTNAKVVHTTANDDGSGSTEIYDMGVNEYSRVTAEKIANDDFQVSELENMEYDDLLGVMKAYNTSYGDFADVVGAETIATALTSLATDGNPDAMSMLTNYSANNPEIGSAVGETIMEGIKNGDETSMELLYNMAASGDSSNDISNLITNLAADDTSLNEENNRTYLTDALTDYIINDDNAQGEDYISPPLTDSEVDILSAALDLSADTLSKLAAGPEDGNYLSDQDKANVLLNYDDSIENDAESIYSRNLEDTDAINTINNILVIAANNAEEAGETDETKSAINDLLAVGLERTIEADSSILSDKDKKTILNNLSNPENASTSTLVDIASAYNENTGSTIAESFSDYDDYYENFFDSYTDALVDEINSGNEQATTLLCKEVYSALKGAGTKDNFLEAVFDGGLDEDGNVITETPEDATEAAEFEDFQYAMATLWYKYSDVNEGEELANYIKSDTNNSTTTDYNTILTNAWLTYGKNVISK